MHLWNKPTTVSIWVSGYGSWAGPLLIYGVAYSPRFDFDTFECLDQNIINGSLLSSPHLPSVQDFTQRLLTQQGQEIEIQQVSFTDSGFYQEDITRSESTLVLQAVRTLLGRLLPKYPRCELELVLPFAWNTDYFNLAFEFNKTSKEISYWRNNSSIDTQAALNRKSIRIAAELTQLDYLQKMVNYDGVYPGYRFSENLGYPTIEHFESIQKLGMSPVHRQQIKYSLEYNYMFGSKEKQ